MSVGVGGMGVGVEVGRTEVGVGVVAGNEVGVGTVGEGVAVEAGAEVGDGVDPWVGVEPGEPHAATASATIARTARGSKAFNLRSSPPSASRTQQLI